MAKRTTKTGTEEQRKQRIALARAIWRLEQGANNLPADVMERDQVFQELKPELLKKSREFERNLEALGYTLTKS